MARRSIVPAILALLVFSAVKVEAAATLPPAASGIADSFLNNLRQGKVADAYHQGLPTLTTQLGSQAMDSAISQTDTMLKSFGTIVDWTEYETDNITPSFVRSTYFVRCSVVPIFLTFQFYNSGNGWKMVDIQINTYQNGRDKSFYGAVSSKQG